ncbi:MAG: desulfoferrodoxin [Lachnospiraceae bacterium]|nr:desulfoferrodoxin [Lachnospiraceae bacterium]
MKFYQCKKCKKIIGMIQPSACPTMCCGDEMVEMVPGTSDGAAEKHVPVAQVDGQTVTVDVGSVAHPMQEEHWIQWIALETKQGMQRKVLNAGDAPKATFALTADDQPVSVYEYCNLHGLWKTDL